MEHDAYLIIKPTRVYIGFGFFSLAVLAAFGWIIMDDSTPSNIFYYRYVMVPVFLVITAGAFWFYIRKRIYVTYTGIIIHPVIGRSSKVFFQDITAIIIDDSQPYSRPIQIYCGKKRITTVVKATVGYQNFENILREKCAYKIQYKEE